MDIENQNIVNPPPVQTAQPPKRFDNKQAIISASVILVIILAIAVGVGMNSSSQDPKNANETVKKKAKVAPTAIPTLPATLPTNWYTVRTQYYNVNVPLGWEPVTEPMQGGVSVIFRPKNMAGDPLMVVESFDTPIVIADKIRLFEAMGLEKKQYVFPKTQPVMATGTWDTRTIDGKTIHTKTQERIVFIPHKNSAFGVKLYYSSPTPIAAYDTALEKVLASFTITSK